MERRHFLCLSAAAALAACAGPMPRSNPLSAEAARSLRFRDIDVSTRGTGFESARARTYASALAPALEAQLRQEFSDRLGSDGAARMVIDVSRLNVADSAQTAFGRDQSRLVGNVRIVGAGGEVLASYGIDVFAGEASESTAGALFGAAVNSSERFYRQLLRRFADATREQVTA